LSGTAYASDYSGFVNVADKNEMKAFARDIGGLLGSGSAQTGRGLGFAGFDVGLRVISMPKSDKDNKAIKNGTGLGLVQAEIGMPMNISGFIRAGSYQGLTAAGGGLRYSLREVSDEDYRLNVVLTGMGHAAVHEDFYAVHWNMSLLCSMNMPVVSPFVSAGFDYTSLKAKTVNASALLDEEVYTTQPRYSAGLMFRLNYFYLSGEASYTHGSWLTTAGAGVRF